MASRAPGLAFAGGDGMITGGLDLDDGAYLDPIPTLPRSRCMFFFEVDVKAKWW